MSPLVAHQIVGAYNHTFLPALFFQIWRMPESTRGDPPRGFRLSFILVPSPL